MNTAATSSTPRARFQRAERKQIEMLMASLDQLVPRDHRVRAVWAYVEALDLGPLYAKIRAVQGRPGRDPVDPRILMALWMFAFRQRMATEAAQTDYKQRASIAEFPNAECRSRGLQQFRVRGLQKVRTVTLWYVITFNFLRMLNLGCLPAPG